MTITLYVKKKDATIISKAKRKAEAADTSLSRIFVDAVKQYMQPEPAVRKLGLPSPERQ